MAHHLAPIQDHYDLESPLATECRRLLHNIRRLESKSEVKSILITSAATGEGKSTIAALLGLTAAKRGFKTLLLDCDLRRPILHHLFALQREQGMAEVLADGQPFKTVIKKTSLDNLDVVTAGKPILHPAELLDSRAICNLISELKFYYDYAFVDTPPVIPVSDPMLLAQELDGTLMVVKAGTTPRELVRRATEIMTNNQIRLLGVVLNNVKGSLPFYYDYAHYHYDYSHKPLAEKSDTGKEHGKTGMPTKDEGRTKADQGSDEARGNRMPR